MSWVGGTYTGAYNDLFPSNGALVGWYRHPRSTITDWRRIGTDLTSVAVDPLFADIAAADFHLRSRQGRWSATAGAWVRDDADSPCIDAGDPSSPFAQEPEPNGGRVNLGAHGNTPEASRSYDQDGDGLGDSQEILLGTDPLLPDTDGDGATDYEEVAAGTDPRDATSTFLVTLSSSEMAGIVELEWPSAAGRAYRVLQADPATGAFMPASSDLPATPPRNRFLVDTAAATSVWFRVELQP